MKACSYVSDRLLGCVYFNICNCSFICGISSLFKKEDSNIRCSKQDGVGMEF